MYLIKCTDAHFSKYLVDYLMKFCEIETARKLSVLFICLLVITISTSLQSPAVFDFLIFYIEHSRQSLSYFHRPD